MREDDRKTQLVIVTGFLFLFLIFKVSIFLYGAFCFGVVFLFLPSLGRHIVKGWFAFAEILGRINSRILLFLVFYLLLVPISLVYRLWNRDTLFLRKDDRPSFFKERKHTYSAQDFENIW